jgi:hypothetical protein
LLGGELILHQRVCSSIPVPADLASVEQVIIGTIMRSTDTRSVGTIGCANRLVQIQGSTEQARWGPNAEVVEFAIPTPDL